MDTNDSDDTHQEPEQPPPIPKDYEPEYDPMDEDFKTPEEPAYQEVDPPAQPSAYPPPLPMAPPAVQPPPAYSYEQPMDQEPPQPPLEPINPWIGIITQPRATIRYVLDSGVWNNVWLLYVIIFLVSIPAVIVSKLASPSGTPITSEAEQVGYFIGLGFGLVIFLIIGYPIGMLAIYIIGALLKITGNVFSGVGSYTEVWIAFTWAHVMGMYINLVMILPYGIFAYYNMTHLDMALKDQYLMIGVFFLVSTPAILTSLYYSSQCIAEAHRFSAWRGLGTVLLTALIVFVTIFVMVFCAILLIAALGIGFASLAQ